MNPSGVTAAPHVVNRFFEFSLLGMLAAGYFAVLGSGALDWPTAARAGIAAGSLAVTSGKRYGNLNSWSQIEGLIESW